MDINTARSLALAFEERDPDSNPRRSPFGKFFSAGGTLHPYEGRVIGAVAFQFSPRVILTLPEVKLVRGDEPLLLLGTDLLVPRQEGWGFMHIGYDPYDMRGIIAF